NYYDDYYFGVDGDNKAYYTGSSKPSAGYLVESIDSNTQITLTTPYEGDTNQTGNAEYALAGQVLYGHGLLGVGVEEADYAEYLDEHLGLPEWGLSHVNARYRDGNTWSAKYRDNVGKGGLCSHQLTALIMGFKTLWNHDAYFDYVDRYMGIMVGYGYRANSDFSEEMWDTYRANYGPVWPSDPNNPTPVLQPIGDKFVDENVTLTFTVNAIDPNGEPITYSAH
ncbi:unnamed protein product, partial [marine sediment metagenome]